MGVEQQASPSSLDDGNDNNEQPQSFCILALYHFLSASSQPDQQVLPSLRVKVETFLRPMHTRGTILLATEGMNGTICFPRCYESDVCDFFRSIFPSFSQIRKSYHHQPVFFRLRVRIKTEIVTMGIQGVDPTQQVGTYVSPGPAWDELIQDPTCLVIDTRNEYEYQVGTFHRAVNPHTQSFTEFPNWLEQQLEESFVVRQHQGENGQQESQQKYTKVAMFCTGGIRCEKATSHCLNELAKQQLSSDLPNIPVYHLKGGILAYLEQVPVEQSTFEGECYVFDQRTAVQHGLRPSETFSLCHACRQPLTPEQRQHHPDEYQEGICCPACYRDSDRVARRQRYEERQKQFGLCDKDGIPHVRDSKEYEKALVVERGH